MDKLVNFVCASYVGTVGVFVLILLLDRNVIPGIAGPLSGIPLPLISVAVFSALAIVALRLNPSKYQNSDSGEATERQHNFPGRRKVGVVLLLGSFVVITISIVYAAIVGERLPYSMDVAGFAVLAALAILLLWSS